MIEVETKTAEVTANAMKDIQIKRVSADQANVVWGIIKDVITWMESEGQNQWSGYYTPERITKKFIEKEDVFVLYENGKAVGTGSISPNFPYYYDEDNIACFTNASKTGTLSTLAILPEYHGRGYAKMLVKAREDFAKKENRFEYLCFDAKADYSKLIEFHKKNGYRVVGSRYEDEGNYYLFEKSIFGG